MLLPVCITLGRGHNHRWRCAVPRLLVAEDERKLVRSLQRGLEAEGFEVATALTGDDAVAKALGEPFDCLILDWLLPGKDGVEVLAALQRAGRRLPVLMLTAKDAVADRVTGLEAGADDYLVKPFAFEELLARVRVCLRRREGTARPGRELR